jgi:hypothetical protein
MKEHAKVLSQSELQFWKGEKVTRSRGGSTSTKVDHDDWEESIPQTRWVWEDTLHVGELRSVVDRCMPEGSSDMVHYLVGTEVSVTQVSQVAKRTSLGDHMEGSIFSYLTTANKNVAALDAACEMM